MDVYGLQPVREGLMLAQCKLCKRVLKLSAFANHYEACVKIQQAAIVVPTPVTAPHAFAPVAQLPKPVVQVVKPLANPAYVSSTRIGGPDAGKVRAPPTPPRLVKLKKPLKRAQEDDDDENENGVIDLGGYEEQEDEEHEQEAFNTGDMNVDAQQMVRPVVGRKTPQQSVRPPAMPPRQQQQQGPPVPPQLSLRRPMDFPEGRAGPRARKEISVLEICKGDNGDAGKVTIMVETGTPVLTRAYRTSSTGSAAPLASRRWTRRNKLTGLSLSFKIRSDDSDCDEDEDDDDDEEEEEEERQERYEHQGGDLSQGWAYTSQRRKLVSPRNDTEDMRVGSKRKAGPPVVHNVNAKRPAPYFDNEKF
jgi:hypothetical protein